jgi:dipeptidyl aminopeptidase/acylaminoacyl peptidase
MSFGAIEAQLLANQGYAVLLPNFRATPGLGSDVFYRGRGEFGRKMQDDIEDATLWLVEQGYSKIGRIALSGASYGGYSTLVGLSRKPQLYQCGIAGLAVTDLKLLMTSGQGDIPQSEFGLALWKSLVGHPVDDKQHLESISPVNLANHIKVPVFMYSGGSDIRVPIEQPEKMKRALESFGNPPQYLVHADEGHGFGTLRANIVTYEKLFRFLDSCLGR